MTLIRFLLLVVVKYISALFYRFDIHWIGCQSGHHFDGVRLGVLLNHTSLYEPLYLRILPFKMLWRFAAWGVFPGADKTMRRPLVGLFYRFLASKPVSITRRRDASWDRFKDAICDRSLIVLAPEGRMKRANGLDLHGRPMTVRGGVVDILEELDEGRMIVLYSGGLHHVQVPGQIFPRPFKRITAHIEVLDIPTYKEECRARAGDGSFRKVVIADLERRRDLYCK